MSLLRSLPLVALLGCASNGAPDGGAPVCKSGQSWKLGEQPTQVMQPGTSCNTCHAQRNIFLFTIAGTVYDAQHEADECFGAPGATVVITDANGATFSLITDVTGNFLIEQGDATIAPPYHAKVVTDGGVSEMITAQSSGDCNGCHTQQGASGAPGRIVAP